MTEITEIAHVIPEMTQLTMWVTVIIFSATILAVITGIIDSSVAAVLGVVAMVWFGTMTSGDAFNAVDWNVMAILVSIWIIAGYLGKSGIPEWLSIKALQISGGHAGLLVMILSMLAGIISLVVDNVVVILMMAPVAIPIVRHLNIPLTPVILMIGFSSNFMGTALLLGDLPPQMLHSVSGAEFLEFIWQDGRPSSFPILMVTFVLTLIVMYLFGFRSASKKGTAAAGSPPGTHPRRPARTMNYLSMPASLTVYLPSLWSADSLPPLSPCRYGSTLVFHSASLR